MGDVINLNKFKKRKRKTERESKAAQNRLKHGESKAERALREKREAAEAKKLDGHKLDD